MTNRRHHTTPSNHESPYLALWAGDLHLDQATSSMRRRLLQSLRSTRSDGVILTGDVANGRDLVRHLTDLAAACFPRPCYFTAGNHDYYASSIAEVTMALAELEKELPNFQALDGKRLIPLGSGTCLMGHGGWADARAGSGHDTPIDPPDRHAIGDFRGMGRHSALRKMTALGKESAAAIRGILPLALSQYQHVVIATHVPPFPTAVRFDEKPCGRAHLPHFCNLSAGLAILRISNAFPSRRLTVLAGHAHSQCTQIIRPNLTVRVGHARTGRPQVFGVLPF